MSIMRVGLCGIGSIAMEDLALYTQGKLHCQITALQSRNVEKMRQAATDFALGDVALFTEYTEMLDSKKVDVVIICTPHEQHPLMAIQAVERGIHVLVEKPLGASRGDCQKLLESLEHCPGIQCGVLYCRRMNPTFQYVKQRIMEDAVGPLKRVHWLITNLYRTDAYHVSAPWRGGWAGECGGVLMTQASHQLDLLLWFCGLPEQVRGFCYTNGRSISVENDAMIQMEFAKGATGQFIASSHEFPGTNRLEICGDFGQIIVEDDKKVILRRLSQPESIYTKSSTCFSGPIPFDETIRCFEASDNCIQQAAIINDFMDAICTGNTPVCSAKDAIMSLAVINATYLSSWKEETISLSFDDSEYMEQLRKRQSKMV